MELVTALPGIKELQAKTRPIGLNKLGSWPLAGPYLLLCLFFLNLFLRLCVAILCPFFFLPFGIALMFLKLLLYCLN